MLTASSLPAVSAAAAAVAAVAVVAATESLAAAAAAAAAVCTAEVDQRGLLGFFELRVPLLPPSRQQRQHQLLLLLQQRGLEVPLSLFSHLLPLIEVNPKTLTLNPKP